MRVSNNMNYDQVKNSISRNRTEVADLQNQASTMKRITKPSDDAVGTARVLALRTDKAGMEQFGRNLDLAKTFLNYTESSLGDVTELLSRAKELALSQASDPSANAITRAAVSTEVDQLFKDLVNIGNRKMGDRFIFGGYKTTHSPFDHEGNYKGDEGSMRVEVSKGVFASINLPGDRIFTGRNSTVGEIPEGRRGATTPNYPALPHQPEDMDQSLQSPSGAQTEKQKDIPIRGPASVDGSGNRSPASLGGLAQINQDEKIEKVQEGGNGENLFKILESLSAGLRANDTVAIQSTLERLDSGLDQAILLRSQVGSRVSSLDNTAESLGKNKIDDATLLSSIEDADAYEVFTDITRNENTLKATLQTSGKLIQPSLLDFLR